MSLQDSNRTDIAYAREVAFNTPFPTIPSNTAVAGSVVLGGMRFTKSTLKANKATVISEEIRDDRQIPALIRVGKDATGGTTHEFSIGDYTDLFAAALMSDWGSSQTFTCSAVSATNQITAAAGTPFLVFTYGNLRGLYVLISGFTNPLNNGIKRIIAIEPSVLHLAPGSLAADQAAVGLTFKSPFRQAYITTTASIDAAGLVITADAGTPFTADLIGARYIHVDGFANAANNGLRKVASATSSVITLVTDGVPRTLEDAADILLQCKYIRTGNTLATYVLEQKFVDAGTYMVYTGHAIDKTDIKLDPKAKATLDFTFVGYQGLRRSAAIHGNDLSAAPYKPSVNPVVNTTDNIGAILVDDGVTSNPVKSIAFNVNQNLRTRPAISEASSLKYGTGWAQITGQLDCYFNDDVLLAKFMDHVPSAIEYPISDALGNLMNFYMPAVQFSGGSPDIPQINTDVMQTLPFQSIEDNDKGYTLQIDIYDNQS